MKNYYQSDLPSSFGRVSQLVAIVIFMSVVTNFATISSANWDREVAYRIEPGISFVLLSISSIDDRLSAGCGYQYLATKGPVVLHVTKNPSWGVTPIVTYELATDGKTNWKVIGKIDHSESPAAIEVTPANPRVLLRVDLEPFRSAIGKYRWGRLVLENGDVAEFEIDNLLPTGNSPVAAAGSFKQEITDLHPSRFGSSFSLVNVTSFPDRLVGDFIFIGGVEGSSIDIKGARDANDDFWPSVTFQVGNSNDEWQTLGASAHKGTQATLKVFHKGPWENLRIRLEAFKPAIGKFKYGKIVFSNGDFAVFEVSHLAPPLAREDPEAVK